MSGEPSRNRDPPGFSCLRPRGFRPAGSLEEAPTPFRRWARPGGRQRPPLPTFQAGLSAPGVQRTRVDGAAPGAPSEVSEAMSGRTIRAPRGTERSCRGWVQEAALRMLMNNLDPEVAERPADLVVYGGTGKAARDWASFDRMVTTLRTLGDDETMLVQSGKPVGVLRTHPDAPRVLLANSNLVGRWSTWEVFRELEAKGLMMYGPMTAMDRACF